MPGLFGSSRWKIVLRGFGEALVGFDEACQVRAYHREGDGEPAVPDGILPWLNIRDSLSQKVRDKVFDLFTFKARAIFAC